ncbi:MAG: adenylate/guanylate cyclase domain-containing protein, partial [Longispora sp.]|nr:adenylate/guanylate cyclase domain-containing protein [Longispora sp. (in: high G+C Gram-positive bacteria)]
MTARQHLPRGQVTFLFTDIEGSTRLAQFLGDDYRPVLQAHRQILRATINACKGAELLTEGDSFFVAFADATTALRACVTAQRALARHPWPTPAARPRVRMGLHTGYAIPIDGEYATFEVHRAARVAAAAHGGQIICSATTARRTESIGNSLSLMSLGLHRLRGFNDREQLFQVVADDLEQHFPPPRTMGATPHNLPTPATSLIGWVEERDALRALIGECRLVTVVGPGGSGKTRLAVTVADDLVNAHPDGVWFTDLAEVSARDGMPLALAVSLALAEALGVRPEPGRPIVDTLTEHTVNRRCLLLIDTCDRHLSTLVPLIGQLLTHCPQLTVLATSREPIGLPGEAVWRIPPLSVEPPIAGGHSDALALLLDRASATRGGRGCDPAELASLDLIARKLEGLPLALELAATRLRVFSAGQLVERLGDLLFAADESANHRHESLGANLSWSYQTLGLRSAELLRRLSVFASPVDLDAIEWLAEGDVLEPLATLVDKSLVHAEPNILGTSYRLLEPIRDYGRQALLRAGENTQARNRHIAWCLHVVEQSARSGDGRPVTLSMRSLDPLANEVRNALEWSSTGGCAREGLRLTCVLDQWWRERGLAREGRTWLYRLYERMSLSRTFVPPAELALAYHVHAAHSGADGKFAEALRFSQRAETAARQADDPEVLVRVLAMRGSYLAGSGLVTEGERACREAIHLASEYGVAAQGLFAVYHLAQLLWRRGALHEAATVLASARSWEAAWPAERGHRTVDMLLGLVALDRGDIVAAHEHLKVTLRSRMTHGFSARAVET